MPSILYPTLTKPILPPAQQPEQVTESRWHQPLSVPMRRKVVVIAAGLVLSPYLAPAPVVAASSQQGQLVRARGPHTSISSSSGKTWTATPPVTIGWFNLLPRPYLSYRAVIDDGAAYLEAPPFPETTTVDRYYKWLSVPALRGGLSTTLQPYLSLTKSTPFPESTTADRWAQPLSYPVRRLYGPPGHVGFTPASPFAEATSIDKWGRPLSSPIWRQSGVLAGDVNVKFVSSTVEWSGPLSLPLQVKYADRPAFSYGYFVAAAAPTVNTSWYQQFSQPAIKLASLFIGPTFVKASPFAETVSADRWYQPLSRPTIVPRIFPSPAFGYGTFVTPPAEIITLDKWFHPFGRPIFVPGYRVFEQPSLYFVKAVPFAETVFLSSWFNALSSPRIARNPTESGTNFVAKVDRVSLDWLAEVRYPSFYARQQPLDSYKTVLAPPPVSTWVSAFAEPPIARLARQYPQTANWLIEPLSRELGLWFSGLVSPKLSVDAGIPVSLFWSDYTPPPEVVTLDKWYHPLSDPVLPEPFVSRYPSLAFVRLVIEAPPGPVPHGREISARVVRIIVGPSRGREIG